MNIVVGKKGHKIFQNREMMLYGLIEPNNTISEIHQYPR